MNAPSIQEEQGLHLVGVTSAPARPMAYRVCTITLGTSLLSVAAVLAATQSSLDLPLLVTLGFLMIAAEHRDRLFGDETSISGSIAIAVASVVAFRENSDLLGPLLCGSVAGFYWPHIRDRVWSKVVINSASIGFSALGAGLVFSALAKSDDGWILYLVGVAPAILTYWLVNSVVLAAATTFLHGGSVLSRSVELVRSETEMLGFAVAGAACGLLFDDVGIWAGALALVALLVLVDVVVISRTRRGAVRVEHPGLAAAVARVSAFGVAGGVAFVVMEASSLVVAVPAGLIAGSTFLFAAMLGLMYPRIRVWDAHLAGGVVAADAMLIAGGAVAGAVAETSSVIVGVTTAVGLLGGGLAVPLLWRRRRQPTEDAHGPPDLDVAAVELALLDGVDLDRTDR